jgi:hypothetical protein
MRIELPAYRPLMFHLYLLDQKPAQEDNRNVQRMNTEDDHTKDYLVIVSVEAGQFGSCKTCHLRSNH